MTTRHTARIITTAHFKNAVDSHISHYETQRTRYPDAGARILRFLDVLEHTVMPMLAANPQLGRPVLFDLGPSAADTHLFQSISQLQTAQGLQARRWVMAPFVVLYFQNQDTVYLVSMKHEKQETYF
jgi:hypothetical protein